MSENEQNLNQDMTGCYEEIKTQYEIKQIVKNKTCTCLRRNTAMYLKFKVKHIYTYMEIKNYQYSYQAIQKSVFFNTAPTTLVGNLFLWQLKVGKNQQ